MSITICEKNSCTGCALCADVCPFGAVEAARDEYGFMKPVIDSEKCTECGMCRKMCPANSKPVNNKTEVYAAYAKDKDIRRKSSSGGIFRLLADKTLEAGGVVAAVGYDNDFRAVYKVAETPRELDDLMRPKYTEALSDGIFKKIKEYLDLGSKVLFVGTPCRTAALVNYFGNDEKLLAVDLICHGVPSPILFEKFLKENFDGNISFVSFRDKTHGWQEFSMRVDTSDKKAYIKSQYKDPYLRSFLSNAALRESCYDCRFKEHSYASDITLGDFWGISSISPSMNDDRGTSAVVVRTEKGSSAFDEIKDLLIFAKTTEAALNKANAALANSSEKPDDREKMLGMIAAGESFSAIAEKFGKPLPKRVIIKERTLRPIKKILGKIKK